MLIGHYAPAFLIKKKHPEIPLWMLFVSVQVLDFVHFVLRLLGVETVHWREGIVGPLAMDLEWIFYSHSLLAAVVWTIVVFVIFWRRKTWAVALSICCFSHWIFDLIVHQPDLALFTQLGPKVGLGLWENLILSFLLEASAFLAAGIYWDRSLVKNYKAILVMVFMMGIQSYFYFTVPIPFSNLIFSLQSLAILSLFALCAWWVIDRPGQFGQSSMES